MINTKRFFTAYSPGVDSITCAIQRASDGFYLQSSDGTFGASPSTLTLTEPLSGGYVLTEDRAVWENGIYDVVFYDTSTPSVVGGYEFQVAQDQILNGIALAALAAKNAVSSIAGALKLINSTNEATTKQISILAGQVNDFSSQTRRGNGSS